MKIEYLTNADERIEVKVDKRELEVICESVPNFTKLVSNVHDLIKEYRAWDKEDEERNKRCVTKKS